MACTSSTHDHIDPETNAPMVCSDCHLPMHYDKSVEDYRHDDPNAPACFLIP